MPLLKIKYPDDNRGILLLYSIRRTAKPIAIFKTSVLRIVRSYELMEDHISCVLFRESHVSGTLLF